MPAFRPSTLYPTGAAGISAACFIREAESGEMLGGLERLYWLKEINALPPKEREYVLYNLDAVLRDFKTRQAYAS